MSFPKLRWMTIQLTFENVVLKGLHHPGQCTKKFLKIRSAGLHHPAQTFSKVSFIVFYISNSVASCLQHSATHYNTLQHTAAHCKMLQRHSVLCIKLSSERPVTHCNTLQHKVMHCNILQHAATSQSFMYQIQ